MLMMTAPHGTSDGKGEAAAEAFRRAAALTRNVPERDYLLLKAGRM